MAAELIAPITVDLRTQDNRMDIIKGLEHISYKDEVLAAGVTCEMGDWLVKNSSNAMEVPGASAVANTYPVVTGNDSLDALATGNVTLIVGGGFLYRTTKYVAGSYTNGQNLTVKGSVQVPVAASGSDPVLARVYAAPDAKGIMTIEVLNR
jgi:hypothetical protein